MGGEVDSFCTSRTAAIGQILIPLVPSDAVAVVEVCDPDRPEIVHVKCRLSDHDIFVQVAFSDVSDAPEIRKDDPSYPVGWNNVLPADT